MGALATAGESVLDRDGRLFGELDFPAPDHIEVVLNGKDVVRIARAHFEGWGDSRPLRLTVSGDDVFRYKRVTTIDGIDLGEVLSVVRNARGAIEALIVSGGGEGEPVAVPLPFVREVSAHIILEPSAEEVDAAQPSARAVPAVREALRRARSNQADPAPR
jgi:sporulation protein YlmC with PRC-barrel domain